MDVKTLKLFTPSLSELAAVLEEGLKKNFESATVRVVTCPDLTQPPYRMPAKGLGDTGRIADVGGNKFMTPVAQLDRKYNLQDVARQMHFDKECSIFGAGAGPHSEIGCNCELMANLQLSASGETQILSQIAKLDKTTGEQNVSQLSTGNFAILGNFYASEGRTGPVLEIKAKRRTGQENFVSCMRKAVANHFPGKSIALGGIFLVPTGKLKIHIMPDFSKVPLKTQTEVDEWLKYFNFSAPMIFYSVFVSEDPGLGLRMEHSHGHSLLDENNRCETNQGGHYHYDTTPDEVEYLAYYNLADVLYKMD